MSRKILLINPWIYDFAAYDFWLKPLGLLYLGALLRRNNHQIHYIDCLDPYHPAMMSAGLLPRRLSSGAGKFHREVIAKPQCLKSIPKKYCRYGIRPDIFKQELELHRDADIVLITSMMTYWYQGVNDAIKIIRETLPDVPIVLGGKYATLCSEHAAQHSGADYIICGTGEKQILQLLRNVWGEETIFEPDYENLDSLPYPALDLVRKLEQVTITTSRGCPYNCSYCSSHIFNDKFRTRNPLQVADEIEYWQRNFGVKNFAFYDDALLVNPEKMIILILQEIKRRKLTCHFHCPNGLHLREINKDISNLLFSAGFQTIRFGFETSDFKRQAETGGKVKNDELRTAVKYLKQAGYSTAEIGIYLLCGLPGQKAKEVEDSINFVLECGARPVLAEYSPIPGTKMWNEAITSSPFDILNEPLYHNNSLLPCRNEDFTYAAYNKFKTALRNLSY